MPDLADEFQDVNLAIHRCLPQRESTASLEALLRVFEFVGNGLRLISELDSDDDYVEAILDYADSLSMQESLTELHKLFSSRARELAAHIDCNVDDESRLFAALIRINGKVNWGLT